MREFEEYLNQKVNEFSKHRTKDAMAYSLMNGGKRIRPRLLFATLEAYGLDPKLGFPSACALEMVHTYSLIHDDLPAMDNDTLRRGKPTCHIEFDEATAILAGDGLLTRAFDVILESKCSDAQKIQLISYLSQYAGVDGMIYGQELDILSESNENFTYDMLLDIEINKTSKLLTLPFLFATILASDYDSIETWIRIGTLVGIQFQMLDDILDVTQSESVLGKSTSDDINQKKTVVSYLGLEGAKKECDRYAKEMYDCLHSLPLQTQPIEEIFSYLLKRTY